MTSQSFTVPPGLETHSFTGVASSGGGGEWIDVSGVPIDNSVNGFILDETNNKILLLWGKASFGKGRYLPVIAPCPEGKDPKETIVAAAKRQSGGLEPDLAQVTDVGGFFITVDGADGKPPFVSFGQAWKIAGWTGEPSETETRRPEWFATSASCTESLPPMPTEKMFEDEQYWYPHFLAGRRVIGRVQYAAPPPGPEGEEQMVGPLKKWWFGFTD